MAVSKVVFHYQQIPFAFIQFPIYEASKKLWSKHQEKTVSPFQAAACGSFAGAIAAAITTPLDVIKTRLILEKVRREIRIVFMAPKRVRSPYQHNKQDIRGRPYRGIIDTFMRITAEEGTLTLFSGVGPRVMWIGIGGFIFFGVYEDCRHVLNSKVGL